MIIHTGMRTDIPAFYAEWFANRLKDGYVMTRNPYHPSQVSRYQLKPEVVDLIGFCTKNPEPMLPYMDLLKPYGMYWFVTITPYGKDIEPFVPDKESVIHSFQALSDLVGVDSMGWRYDPIFLNETYTAEYHLECFADMAEKLDGYTHTCVISFIDIYEKVYRNFPEARQVEKADRLYLGEQMIQIASEHGMTVKPCAEGRELGRFGADCSGCMTKETYETALHTRLDIPGKAPARKECACFLGNDVGAYNTCMHGCRYCYANYDRKTVEQNYRQHDPKSPLLIGHIMPEDTIHDAKQESWINGQMSLEQWL